MASRDEAVEKVAEKHGLSRGAVAALWDALARGGGRQAQFDHPDLGGMGQWSGGGMVQIGDMFNNALKAKVGAACADLSAAMERQGGAGAGASPSQHHNGGSAHAGGAQQRAGHGGWWPGDLGRPSTSGSQNAMRYAYFPDTNRLAIENGGRVTVYDTGGHRISGVSQGQSRGQHLEFTSQDGKVDIDSLKVVDRQS